MVVNNTVVNNNTAAQRASKILASAGWTHDVPDTVHPRAASTSDRSSVTGAVAYPSSDVFIEPSSVPPKKAAKAVAAAAANHIILLFHHHSIGPGCICLTESGESWAGFVRTALGFRRETSFAPVSVPGLSRDELSRHAASKMLKSFFLSPGVLKAMIQRFLFASYADESSRPERWFELQAEELANQILVGAYAVPCDDKLIQMLRVADYCFREAPDFVYVDVIVRPGFTASGKNKARQNAHQWSLLRKILGLDAHLFLPGETEKSTVLKDIGFSSPVIPTGSSSVKKPESIERFDQVCSSIPWSRCDIFDANARDMLVIGKYCFGPLRSGTTQHMVKESLLTQYIPKVNDVLAVHSKLTAELVQLATSKGAKSEIDGEYISEFCKIILPNISEIKRLHEKIIVNLNLENARKIKKDVLVSNYLAECFLEMKAREGKSVMDGELKTMFNSYMPAIMTLLRSLLETVDRESQEYPLVAQVEASWKSALDAIDKQLGECNSKTLVFFLDDYFKLSGQLVKNSMRYVSEIVVNEITKHKAPVHSVLMLFTESIVVLRKKCKDRPPSGRTDSAAPSPAPDRGTRTKSSYKYESLIELNDLACVSTSEKTFELMVRYKDGDKTSTFTFEALDADDKADFLRMLRHTMICREHPRQPIAPKAAVHLFAQRYGHIDIYYNLVETTEIFEPSYGDVLCIVYDDTLIAESLLCAHKDKYKAAGILHITPDGRYGYVLRTQLAPHDGAMVSLEARASFQFMHERDFDNRLSMSMRNLSLVPLVNVDSRPQASREVIKRQLLKILSHYSVPSTKLERKSSLRSMASGIFRRTSHRSQSILEQKEPIGKSNKGINPRARGSFGRRPSTGFCDPEISMSSIPESGSSTTVGHESHGMILDRSGTMTPDDCRSLVDSQFSTQPPLAPGSGLLPPKSPHRGIGFGTKHSIGQKFRTLSRTFTLFRASPKPQRSADDPVDYYPFKLVLKLIDHIDVAGMNSALIIMVSTPIDDVVFALKHYMRDCLDEGLIPEGIRRYILTRISDGVTHDADLRLVIKPVFGLMAKERRKCIYLALRHWRRISDNCFINQAELSDLTKELSRFIAPRPNLCDMRVAQEYDGLAIALECMVWNYDWLFSDIHKEPEATFNPRSRRFEPIAEDDEEIEMSVNVLSFASGDSRMAAAASTGIVTKPGSDPIQKSSIAQSTAPSARQSVSAASKPATASVLPFTQGGTLKPEERRGTAGKAATEHLVEKPQPPATDNQPATEIVDIANLPENVVPASKPSAVIQDVCDKEVLAATPLERYETQKTIGGDAETEPSASEHDGGSDSFLARDTIKSALASISADIAIGKPTPEGRSAALGAWSDLPSPPPITRDFLSEITTGMTEIGFGMETALSHKMSELHDEQDKQDPTDQSIKGVLEDAGPIKHTEPAMQLSTATLMPEAGL
ncbi:hypothetical protein HK105_207924 [Polyrhizophydium stewartii]|uniref:Uncharacterized protein n=1 Tax=Polyrhizophydium stewartii TaxID=2732419 RepID=A0ABR4MZK4_9FUNG